MGKVGRPSTYNDKIGEEICLIVSTTPKMLEDICAENPQFPDAKTVYEWRIKYPEFGQKYTIAKQEQIEVLVSTILFKVRKREDDFFMNGDNKVVNTAAINRLRMEVDAIKWFAGKLAPKLYGEKASKDDKDKAVSLLATIMDSLDNKTAND